MYLHRRLGNRQPQAAELLCDADVRLRAEVFSNAEPSGSEVVVD